MCSICLQTAAIAIMAILRGFKSLPRQQGSVGQAYTEGGLQRLGAEGRLLELPEGQSCDIRDCKGEDATCVPHATWQQLMTAKVCSQASVQLLVQCTKFASQVTSNAYARNPVGDAG